MNWLAENEFSCKSLVVIEDHVYHISELLRTIQSASPELMANLTFVCLDRRGPDTDEAVQEWLSLYPSLQVAARLSDKDRFAEQQPSVQPLGDEFFQSSAAYCRTVAGFLRKRGLLIQDIDLETLEFIPRDRWWETTMLASTVRGMVGERAPHCAFISNKRGYEATFGAELLAAGHDPRDVLNKYELERVVVPFMETFLKKNFPWQLRISASQSCGTPSTASIRIAEDRAERQEIEKELGVVLWPSRDQVAEIGGNAFDNTRKQPVQLNIDGNEYQTWHDLIEARLEDRIGVEVIEIGERVAAAGALRAETTNSAARHIHSLRKRLIDASDIVTVQGHYRLREGLRVGLANVMATD